MNKTFLAAMGLVAVMATPALADSPCLQLDQIWNWKAVDNKTLIVVDYRQQKFKVSLMAYCPNLTDKQRIGFKSIGGMAISCLTKGDEVFVHDIGMRTVCPITDIVFYTPEMEKADKAAAAAKAQQRDAY